MIYMLIGIQGSGKSTLSKKLSKDFNCDIISTDYVRKTHPGIDEKLVWVTVYDLLAEHVKANKDAIYDATNVTPKVRRRFFNELFKRGVKPNVIAYFLDTPMNVCYERVVKRNEKPDELYLPLEVIGSYSKTLIPPYLSEGFLEIRTVKEGEVVKIEKRKLNLKNDYSHIMAKEILNELEFKANYFYNGYGEDDESKAAKIIISREIDNEKAQIEFINGGTMANKLVIDTLLKPYEAIISCDTSHINVHETGAIEELGHKLLTHPNKNGKVDLEEIKNVVNNHVDYHMVKPRLVYISNTTELGTVYTKEELEQLHKLCQELDLLLFIDGARLFVALESRLCDYDLKFLASICDAFTIGGAKLGLPYGEAVIFNKAIDDIQFRIKRQGAMLSKGFIPGIMFKCAIENNLFKKYAKAENDLAYELEEELGKLGIKFLAPVESNQIFVIVTNEEYAFLSDNIEFELWKDAGNMKVIRLVTSFSTTHEDIKKCIDLFSDIRKEEGLKC